MMRVGNIGILLTIFATALLAADPNERTPDAFGQIVVVTTKDWNTVDGWLQRFEGGNAVGPRIRVALGRNGLGWGLGRHPMPQNGPQKKEGDGKGPAGVFSLTSAFGYASLEEMKTVKLPYVQCTTMVECVDDVKSVHYNTVLNRTNVAKPDWNSSEIMLMKDNEYSMGIVIDHNAAPPKAGGGSCVFMHIWRGPGVGTSGCTAMTPENMDILIHWLDPKEHPILVQLPDKEYERVREDWRLPDLPETPKTDTK